MAFEYLHDFFPQKNVNLSSLCMYDNIVGWVSLIFTKEELS